MPFNWRQQLKLWLYIVFICGVLRLVFFYQNIHSPLVFSEQAHATLAGSFIQVESGTTFTELTATLKRQGILKHRDDIRIYAKFSGKAAQIKAGEYFLNEGITALQLLNKLTQGEVNYHQLVLLEGWTLLQALKAIQANENIITTINLADKVQLETVLKELLQTDVYPEGLLFPDTYNFVRGTTDVDILRRAQQLLNQVLEEEWSARAVGLPYQSAYEALIMASIVEKETGLASEREQISGVFVRRLQEGMRLQTDPTVIYGLGEGFDGNLTRANLRERTVYNTYTINGLPPTPIALVGREAIAASLHPDSSNSLYFVAKGDGSHYFSATLAEHNAAVRQYQLGIE